MALVIEYLRYSHDTITQPFSSLRQAEHPKGCTANSQAPTHVVCKVKAIPMDKGVVTALVLGGHLLDYASDLPLGEVRMRQGYSLPEVVCRVGAGLDASNSRSQCTATKRPFPAIHFNAYMEESTKLQRTQPRSQEGVQFLNASIMGDVVDMQQHR